MAGPPAADRHQGGERHQRRPDRKDVTLPLFTGGHNGQAVYYVVTDDSSQADAAARGVNWAPKLVNALGTAAVQSATLPGGVVQFPGIVDFVPNRVVTPGPVGNEFAGGTYAPGAVGDAAYSPLITIGGGSCSTPPRSPTTPRSRHVVVL